MVQLKWIKCEMGGEARGQSWRASGVKEESWVGFVRMKGVGMVQGC